MHLMNEDIIHTKFFIVELKRVACTTNKNCVKITNKLGAYNSIDIIIAI